LNLLFHSMQHERSGRGGSAQRRRKEVEGN
jgi:hypothetical protein